MHNVAMREIFHLNFEFGLVTKKRLKNFFPYDYINNKFGNRYFSSNNVYMSFIKVRQLYIKRFSRVFSAFTNTMQKGIIAIIGTTGVGKSDLGVQLAKILQGEIINGDSMQVTEVHFAITKFLEFINIHEIFRFIRNWIS
jgi:hypothetical protein